MIWQSVSDELTITVKIIGKITQNQGEGIAKRRISP